MKKKMLILLASYFLLVSCSALKNEFGEVVFDQNKDSVQANQEIARIRGQANDIFDDKSFAGREQIEIKYRLYQPAHNQVDKKFPLVVVYHGSGAIGTDNTTQLGLLAKLFASPNIQEKYPAYVLAPQFPTRSSDYAMDSSRNVLFSKARPCLNSVMQLIDSLKYALDIDEKRIYVVGYSMGASTVINSLSSRPDLFAAGIGIAGIPQFDQAQVLSKIPIWLIHGLEDDENPIPSNEQFFKEYSSKIRFWKFIGLGHEDIITSHILGNALPEWLFRHVKK